MAALGSLGNHRERKFFWPPFGRFATREHRYPHASTGGKLSALPPERASRSESRHRGRRMRLIRCAAVLATSTRSPPLHAPADPPSGCGKSFRGRACAPVLVEKCVSCHGAREGEGWLARLDTPRAVLAGGDRGPGASVPGKPEGESASEGGPPHRRRPENAPVRQAAGARDRGAGEVGGTRRPRGPTR